MGNNPIGINRNTINSNLKVKKVTLLYLKRNLSLWKKVIQIYLMVKHLPWFTSKVNNPWGKIKEKVGLITQERKVQCVKIEKIWTKNFQNS